VKFGNASRMHWPECLRQQRVLKRRHDAVGTARFGSKPPPNAEAGWCTVSRWRLRLCNENLAALVGGVAGFTARALPQAQKSTGSLAPVKSLSVSPPGHSKLVSMPKPIARPESTKVDYSALYDAHPEYVARRASGSIEQALVSVEVRQFKLPGLMKVLPAGKRLKRVLEIGCATGELIAAVPIEAGGQRIGIDISPANVAAARARFPDVEFHCGDFRDAGFVGFDAVIISDVLEHVPDDVEFLHDAARLGDIVLVNLPLEDNWLNDRRPYGPDDVSGHLRRYSLTDGLGLFRRAGLEVHTHLQVWVHETPTDAARRALRSERLGAAYSGNAVERFTKQLVLAIAVAAPTLGRRLFASNLFAAVSARR
jgi:SAM-dependent methyltransferase